MLTLHLGFLLLATLAVSTSTANLQTNSGFLCFQLHAEEQPAHYSFRSVFRTPKDAPKRNYDDFEILERASFHSEASEAAPLAKTSKGDSPKATASAQIHVRIADKRAVKEAETAAVKEKSDVDDTLKKLLIMLIKPIVENNNGPGRVNPFFPFPPSPHPSPPYAHLLGGLSALSGLSNSPEVLKKAAKMAHKLKEQLKATNIENEIEELKKAKTEETIPLKITLNNKPMRLQAEGFEENASVAEKNEKLVDLMHLLGKHHAETEEEEEKPKRKKKKPKLSAVDPLEVYMRRMSNFQENGNLYGLAGGNLYAYHPLLAGCNCNSAPCNCNNQLLNSMGGLNYDLAAKLRFLAAQNRIVPVKPEVLATEFVVHVPVLINNKQPAYNDLANYPLLNSLLANYGRCIGATL